MKKVLPLLLLAVSSIGLASCGPKKEKESIDYKNDTLEALIEKAGVHQENPGYLNTYSKSYANSCFYSISRFGGNDYYIWSETKLEQYYCYNMTLKYEPAEGEGIALHYSWIDENYPEKPDKTNVIYCSGVSNDVRITVEPYGLISLWTVNVKEIVVNYSNKTFAKATLDF